MVASVDSLSSPVYSSVVTGAGSSQVQSTQQDAPPAGVATSTETVTISTAATIQLGRDQTIQGGKLVQQTDHAYAKQQELLNKMDNQLQGILKQFPPYGAEDPQRVAYLKEFSGLKKEIEALQFPKDSSAEQGLPKGVALASEGGVPTLPSLNGATVSDQQVSEAAKQVQSAYEQVAAHRQALAQSVQVALGGNGYASLVKNLS